MVWGLRSTIIIFFLFAIFFLFLGQPIVYIQLITLNTMLIDYSISKLLIAANLFLGTLFVLKRGKINFNILSFCITLFNLILIINIIKTREAIQTFIYYLFFFSMLTYHLIGINYYKLFTLRRSLEKIFRIIYFPILLVLLTVGFIQFFTNFPLVNKYIGLPSWGGAYLLKNKYLFTYGYFLGSKLRVFSLFFSPLTYGIFLLFSFAYTWHVLSCTKSKFSKVFLMLFLILEFFQIYSTHTRNIYLSFIFEIIFLIFWLKKKRNYLFLLLFPLIQLLSILPVYSVSYLLDYQYTASLLERFSTWGYIFKELLSSPLKFLFGCGLIQWKNSGIVIDNSLIALLSFTGFIGTVIFFFYYYKLFISIIQLTESKYQIQTFAFERALIALFAVFPALSMYNNFLGGILLFFSPPVMDASKVVDLKQKES